MIVAIIVHSRRFLLHHNLPSSLNHHKMCSYPSLDGNMSEGVRGMIITTACINLSLPLHLPFIHLRSEGCESRRQRKLSKFHREIRERPSAHGWTEKAFNSSHPHSSSTVIEDFVRPTTNRREFPENYPSKSFSRCFCEWSTKGQ